METHIKGDAWSEAAAPAAAVSVRYRSRHIAKAFRRTDGQAAQPLDGTGLPSQKEHVAKDATSDLNVQPNSPNLESQPQCNELHVHRAT